MPDRPALRPAPEILHTFDVYRMPVRFEEDRTRSRNHYVACVVDADNDGGVAVKLTSNPKWHDAGDVRLLDWAQAGLAHGTTARCGQLVRFRRSDLQGFTGTLSRTDAVRLVTALAEVPPERVVWP